MELPTLITMIIFEFKILRKCLPLYILPWEKEQTEILLAPFSNMPTSTQSRKRQSRAVMLEWEPSIRVGRMKGPAVGWKPKVAWCQPCYMPSTRALQRAGGMVCREERTSGAHPAQIFQSSKQSFTRECIGTAFSLCSAKCMWQSTDLICMVLCPLNPGRFGCEIALLLFIQVRSFPSHLLPMYVWSSWCDLAAGTLHKLPQKFYGPPSNGKLSPQC